MYLTQKRQYLSIKQLPPTELPSFALLTGVNGAGKTHLLKALAEGAVAADIAPDRERDIRYFDWTSLVPANAGNVTIQNLYSKRDAICSHVRTRRDEQAAELAAILSSAGVEVPPGTNRWRLAQLSPEELAALTGNSGSGQTLHQKIRQLAEKVTNQARQDLRNDQQAIAMLNQAARELGQVASVDEQYFSSRPLGWSQQDMFQQKFAEMFLAYFDKRRSNKLRQLDEREGRTPDEASLTEEEFLEANGAPPWQFVNETIRHAGLDFEIDHPVRYDLSHYKPILTKVATGDQVEFQSLSSGEKVLMSFAFCLYYSLDDRPAVTRPKLLLFDEIDAPLHPSMSRVLVETINDVLVRKHEISVIFATHSPSTVAVAPDEAIHLMEPVSNKISGETKRRAIATLTAEIPTLSISVDGRRQVFVESEADADRYQRLYLNYAPSISSERSLVFIGVGAKDEAGSSAGGGCDQVRKIVRELTKGGNSTVLGLVDWDGEHSSVDRLRVLAEDARYSIENCLLDPLLVAAAVLREMPSSGSELGLDATVTYRGFSEIGQVTLQAVADKVAEKVLKNQAQGDGRTCRYEAGFDVNVSRQYLEMNGHTLEERVKAAFGPLNRFQRSGELLMFIVGSVLRDHPGLCPAELVNALRELCEMDV